MCNKSELLILKLALVYVQYVHYASYAVHNTVWGNFTPETTRYTCVRVLFSKFGATKSDVKLFHLIAWVPRQVPAHTLHVQRFNLRYGVNLKKIWQRRLSEKWRAEHALVSLEGKQTKISSYAVGFYDFSSPARMISGNCAEKSCRSKNERKQRTLPKGFQPTAATSKMHISVGRPKHHPWTFTVTSKKKRYHTALTLLENIGTSLRRDNVHEEVNDTHIVTHNQLSVFVVSAS